MRRPVGVILTCSVLGISAAFESLLAALTILAAVVAAGNLNQTAQDSNRPALLIASAIALLVLAAWSILTAGGLLRLLPSARRSVMLLAGLIVALSLAGIALAHRQAHAPAPADSFSGPASTMQNPILIEARLWTFFNLLAGWWLVYFNLKSTKAYFLPAYRTDACGDHREHHANQL